MTGDPGTAEERGDTRGKRSDHDALEDIGKDLAADRLGLGSRLRVGLAEGLLAVSYTHLTLPTIYSV